MFSNAKELSLNSILKMIIGRREDKTQAPVAYKKKIAQSFFLRRSPLFLQSLTEINSKILIDEQ